MSLISLFIIKNEKVYFGSVHWRELEKGLSHCLPLLKIQDFDAGYIFADFDKEFILNEQHAVCLKSL